MADMIQSPPQAEAGRPDVLGEIERQVLWLSTAIIDHANRVRPNPGGMKVGGHQASSASMVSIMTALWFGPLQSRDRVSVKPHASPVLHAINYLLGELDESYLPTLRAFAGLQSYPSRVKDPEEWTTGDEPMTGAQDSYLHTLAREAGEPVEEDLTKAEASQKIDKLQEKTGRGKPRQSRRRRG